MTRDPNFDELVGSEPTGSERERLRRAHELLLQAGPPPELPPGLAGAPRLDPAPEIRRRRNRRRAVLVLAAAVVVAAVFAAGYGVGRSGGASPAAVLALKGTAAAPNARATLQVLPEQAGNWPMRLAVAGLPKLPPHEYYAVFLVRKGERYLSCGTFVTTGGGGTVRVTLNAPYRLRTGDTWIVTWQAAHASGHGATVLRPA